jgi:unsaturated rhamnogalacturonyl hydrolase
MPWSDEPASEFTVTNPISVSRTDETIGLDWDSIADTVPGLTEENAAIYELQSRQFLVTQIADIDGNTKLMFQADFAPEQTKSYRLMIIPDGVKKPHPQATTYCCFLPERSDDFAWENDKVANRMYGPALEWETITSGVDAWGKCVPYPVVEKFIRDYVQKEIPYHENHGEGGVFYQVGNTLGCGGLAPFVGGKVRLPRNFSDWKVLANGPIRSVFELTYKTWKAGNYTVSETKRISIDLGSNMSRFECRYETEGTETLPLAAGIVLRDTSEQTWTADNIIAYWLPTDFVEGMFGCGVVFGADYKPGVVNADSHLLLKLEPEASAPVIYYAGSCWDENTDFDSFEKWRQYLAGFKERIDNPVILNMSSD